METNLNERETPLTIEEGRKILQGMKKGDCALTLRTAITRTERGWKIEHPNQGYSEYYHALMQGFRRGEVEFCATVPGLLIDEGELAWDGKYDRVLSRGYVVH